MTAVGGSSPIWMYQEPVSSRTVCEPLMRWLRRGGRRGGRDRPRIRDPKNGPVTELRSPATSYIMPVIPRLDPDNSRHLPIYPPPSEPSKERRAATSDWSGNDG